MTIEAVARTGEVQQTTLGAMTITGIGKVVEIARPTGTTTPPPTTIEVAAPTITPAPTTATMMTTTRVETTTPLPHETTIPPPLPPRGNVNPRKIPTIGIAIEITTTTPRTGGRENLRPGQEMSTRCIEMTKKKRATTKTTSPLGEARPEPGRVSRGNRHTMSISPCRRGLTLVRTGSDTTTSQCVY